MEPISSKSALLALIATTLVIGSAFAQLQRDHFPSGSIASGPFTDWSGSLGSVPSYSGSSAMLARAVGQREPPAGQRLASTTSSELLDQLVPMPKMNQQQNVPQFWDKLRTSFGRSGNGASSNSRMPPRNTIRTQEENEQIRQQLEKYRELIPFVKDEADYRKLKDAYTRLYLQANPLASESYAHSQFATPWANRLPDEVEQHLRGIFP